MLKQTHVPYILACNLQIDADADPDPAHHFMRIRIQLITSMRIRILPFNLMRIHTNPYPDPITLQLGICIFCKSIIEASLYAPFTVPYAFVLILFGCIQVPRQQRPLMQCLHKNTRVILDILLWSTVYRLLLHALGHVFKTGYGIHHALAVAATIESPIYCNRGWGGGEGKGGREGGYNHAVMWTLISQIMSVLLMGILLLQIYIIILCALFLCCCISDPALLDCGTNKKVKCHCLWIMSRF